MATMKRILIVLALVAGCGDGKTEAPDASDAVCIAPEPGSRPYCGNPVDTDALEVVRQSLGAACVRFCCDDPADDFKWCGPSDPAPDGGAP